MGQKSHDRPIETQVSDCGIYLFEGLCKKTLFISLGSVGHDGIGGSLDDASYLLDGRSYLTQTVETIAKILHRKDGIEPFPASVPERSPENRKLGNYERYIQASFNQYTNYPSQQSVPPDYIPVANWIDRLILPDHQERDLVRGIFFEVYY